MNPKRNLATFLLVLGAVLFGMVLAGGLQMTVPGQAADQAAANLSATRLAAQHPALGQSTHDLLGEERVTGDPLGDPPA